MKTHNGKTGNRKKVNKDTIRNLALSNVLRNRTRSILITITIFLATFLLTVIGSLGYGLIKNENANAGVLYGNYYGTYKAVTPESLARMELRSEFTDIGKLAILGSVDYENSMTLIHVDDMAVSMTNMEGMMSEGKYPVKGNEIAAQSTFFKRLGISEPKLGDSVTLSYRTDLSSPFEEETFVISGLLKEPESAAEAASLTALVSQEYYESRIPAEERSYKVYFRMDETLGINSSNAEEVMKELAEECGIDKLFVSDNSMYLIYALNPGMELITACIMIALLVSAFSMVVIYNIFQVGIKQKIQEYGKLKAIGATRKQMKNIVLTEGMILAAVGIPAGVIAGCPVSAAAFAWIMKGYTHLDVIHVSVLSLPILILAAFVSLLTVRLALRKPMKIIAGISAVEAMRYQESTGQNKGIRKGHISLTERSLTMANLSENRKRTVSTIVSMGLSCVLFVIIASVIGSMDPEMDARKQMPYGQFEISLDFSLTDTAYPENNLDNILKDNPINQELISDMKELKGVTDVSTGKVLYAEIAEEKYKILVVGEDEFDKMLKHAGVLGEFDYDEVSESAGILYGWSNFMRENGFQIGQEVDLEVYDGANTKQWKTRMMGSFGSANSDFVMTEAVFRELALDEGALNKVWVDCDVKDRMQVREGIRELLTGREHIQIAEYENYLKSTDGFIGAMRITGYAFCLFIAVISFMNMANTIITSIITRKQEFGVLQAVGMTNAQLNRSLRLEGAFFTIGTLLVSMVVGIPAGYLIFLYQRSIGFIGLQLYRFPVVEILLMGILLGGMQAFLSFILSRNVKRESLVDRIRYQG